MSPALLLAALCSAVLADAPFNIWLDAPGTPLYNQLKPSFYDLIVTQANTSFVSGSATIAVRACIERICRTHAAASHAHAYILQVNMAQHGAIHLFADPAFQNGYDDVIRAWSGDLASQLYACCKFDAS
jgi:hypothetical protein